MEANTLNPDQTAQVSKNIEIGTCPATQKLLAICDRPWHFGSYGGLGRN